MVTVFDMLECHGMDILPFPLNSSRNESASHGTRLQIDEYHTDDEGCWCLFSIKVRNTYGLPFQVSLERVQEGQLQRISPSRIKIPRFQAFHTPQSPRLSLKVRWQGRFI